MKNEVEIKIREAVINLRQGDITTIAADAVVNAANPGLMGGGGVDGAIHRAGGPAILEECKKIISEIGKCRTGQAVITTGGNMPASYVIHTVGPVWRGGGQAESEMLSSAYRESLRLADRKGLESIAFPSISTGAYGYPVREASFVAVKTVIEYLQGKSSIRKVLFVLFDKRTFEAYKQAADELRPRVQD